MTISGIFQIGGSHEEESGSIRQESPAKDTGLRRVRVIG
jgi:hypothetical protein